jgi:hypothetical protein
MNRLIQGLKIVALNLLIFAIAMEIGLRLVPSAIPESLLKRFQPPLRASIAERRSLPNVSDVVQVQRDDGGPPLLIFKPNASVQFYSRETGKTGKIQMDERGFCNPAGRPSEGESADVVALGDSFTACMNEPPDSVAPESYINWPFEFGRLAGVRVYNLSRGGDGLYEYVQLLRHYGLQFKPSMVIMQVYEGNDLRDAQRYHSFKQMSPEEKANVPLRASWEPLKVSYDWLLQNWLGQWSYAYDFFIVGGSYLMSEAIEQFWISAGSDAAVNFRFYLNYGGSPVLMNPDNDQKDEVRTARAARTGEYDFSAFDEALEKYSELAREHGFKAVLSYAPAAHVAYEGKVNFEDPNLNELLLWYSQRQRDYFAEKCKELGIVFIDLTPALQAEIERQEGAKLLYNPSNIHFTVLGHRIVAQELLRMLTEDGALPLP